MKSYLVVLILLGSMCFGCDKEGVTPFMLAARSGDNAELVAHISEGVNLNEKSDYGWTALMFASWKGHKSAVQTLLQAGADPNIISDKIPSKFMATSGGRSPSTALREAIKNRHVEIANILLDAGAKAEPGAFAIAGGVGNTALLSRFLELDADINQISSDGFYRTPLCVAARVGNLEAVQWLINHGAKPNLIAVRQTALEQAATYNHVDIVKYLLESGANPNQFHSMRSSALYSAVTKYTNQRDYAKNFSVIKLLLSHGLDPTSDAYVATLELVRKQAKNSVKAIQAVTDDKIRKRHEASLQHKRAIIGLLEKEQVFRASS